MLKAPAETLPELSVIIPCLNESETLWDCIATAEEVIAEAQIRAEIIVVDNGSTDDSVEIAREFGVRIVHVAERGYGAALKGGVEAARGEYVFMADSDGSYDFRDLIRFIIRLRAGCDLVQGRRDLDGPSADRSAMPWWRRRVVHPLLNSIAKRVYGVSVDDSHSGMRAMTREFFHQLQLQSSGPEIASEIIVKASLFEARITQTPVSFRSDGREKKRSQIELMCDSWRRIRFMLLMCPQWVLVFPGYVMMMLGMLAFFVGGMGAQVGLVSYDAPLLWSAVVMTMVGFQSLQFGVYAKAIAAHVGLLPHDESTARVVDSTGLERGLLLGGGSALAGLIFLFLAGMRWAQSGYSDSLNSLNIIRLAAPGLALIGIGMQAAIGEFAATLISLVSPKTAKRNVTEPLRQPSPIRTLRRRERMSPWDSPILDLGSNPHDQNPHNPWCK